MLVVHGRIASVLNEIDNFVKSTYALTVPHDVKELSEELRPIVVKFRKFFGPMELASALSDALLAQAGRRPDRALDRAVARGLMVREAIKEEEGGHISADEAGRVLGISKPAVLERFKKGQLLGWRESRQGAVRFPVWQFTDGGLLAGLPEILPILAQAAGIDDWGKIAFFLNRRNSLKGKRSLDLLREGKVATVKRLAWADVEP
jgi:hypothetical protein